MTQRARCSLHATLPDGWLPYSARDVVVVARPPAGSGWFCPTLLVAQEEVPVSFALRALFDATAARLDELGDGVEILGHRYHLDEGADGTERAQVAERVSRLVAFDASSRQQRVAQLQCFVAPPASATHDRTRPVAQFVGTCALDELDRYGPAFVGVVESIRFERRAPDGSIADYGASLTTVRR